MTKGFRVEWIPVERLKPAPYNPREELQPGDPAYESLKKSINRYGLARPITVNKDMTVIGGNQTLGVIKAAGLAEVPCVIMNLTKKQEKELNVALNKIDGKWDPARLKDLLLELDVDAETLETMGWTDNELDKLLRKHGGWREEKEEDFDVQEAIEKVVEPVTKLGDIWTLGKNRLMCGDATDINAVRELMAGKLADMVFTDPPYNVAYQGRGQETSREIKNDNLDDGSFRKMLQGAFDNYYDVMNPAAVLYCCYASRTHRQFEDALNQAGFEVRNQIIWVKIVASMGWGDYRWKHEPMFYCARKGDGTRFYGERDEYTVWEEHKTDDELLKMFKAMTTKEENGNSTVWRFKRDSHYKHPTQKPVDLVGKAIHNSSLRGDIILDLFAGSGTTIIAAEQKHRIGYAMELDPTFCDVIIQRWEKYTEQRAEKCQK